MEFTKYEAAGNSYIIANKDHFHLTTDQAIKCCSPIYGAGGDGIITWKQIENRITVMIFNPDGSLAEKSGNGLRILATHLFSKHFKAESSITLSTTGGEVIANRDSDKFDSQILLEMGTVFCQFEHKGLSDSPIFKAGTQIETKCGSILGHSVSIGNPHFVIFDDQLSAENAQKFGPHIENHPLFTNRTNVQFAKVIDPQNIMAEIWERGAGYTLSSGSSSCAIAAVAHSLGKCDPQVTVSMPGGKLKVEINEDGNVWLTGPVNKTIEGKLEL